MGGESGRRDSDPRPSPFHKGGDVLPLNYARDTYSEEQDKCILISNILLSNNYIIFCPVWWRCFDQKTLGVLLFTQCQEHLCEFRYAVAVAIIDLCLFYKSVTNQGQYGIRAYISILLLACGLYIALAVVLLMTGYK